MNTQQEQVPEMSERLASISLAPFRLASDKLLPIRLVLSSKGINLRNS